jgi:hypothetical protein
MKNRTHTRRRWFGRVALGLAVVAVAAPSAQAMIPADSTGSPDSGQVTDGLGRPLDPALVRSGDQVAAVVVDTSKFRIDAQIADDPVRPDDRPVRPTVDTVNPEALPTPFGQVFGIDSTPQPVRPDDRAERPVIVGGDEAPLVVPTGRVHGPVAGDTTLVADQPQSAPVSGPSFDWNDAGVGIGIGFAACLALLAAWMLLGHRKPDRFAGA